MILTWRSRALTLASAFIALSLLFSARAFLSEKSLPILELPLVMSASVLFAWGAWAADARMNRTWTTWLTITGTVVSLLVYALLLAFPNGDIAQRILLTLAATLTLAGAIWKAGTS